MDTTNELLDYFDEQMRHVGTATRAEVHRRGYLHQTFHCWVLCRRPSGAHLLLQQRQLTKESNPGKLDVSCAGHLLAGETAADGVRELAEELGVEVPFAELGLVGQVREDYSCGALLDREVAHVYRYETARLLTQFRPDPVEVSGLYEVLVTDLHKLVYSEVDELIIPLFGMELNEQGDFIPASRMLRMADLVERKRSYYDLIFSVLSEPTVSTGS